MKISRGRKILFSLTLGSLIWIYLIMVGVESKYFRLNFYNYYSEIIYSLPSYLLILFGSYAVFSIGSDLAVLKDFPEEQTSLLKEIQEAKLYFTANKVLKWKYIVHKCDLINTSLIISKVYCQ